MMTEQEDQEEPIWARKFLIFLQALAIVLAFTDAAMFYLDYITKHHR